MELVTHDILRYILSGSVIGFDYELDVDYENEKHQK